MVRSIYEKIKYVLIVSTCFLVVVALMKTTKILGDDSSFDTNIQEQNKSLLSGSTTSEDNIVVEEGLTYTILDGEASVKGNNDTITKAVIKEFINEVPVTSVEIDAFYGYQSLVEVIMPKSITKIGISSFNNCVNLTQIGETPEIIDLSSVINIGRSSFARCNSIKKVILSEQLNDLDQYVFSGCKSLTQIGNYKDTIDLSNVSSLSGSVFSGASSIKKVLLSPNLTKLYERVFQACTSLEQIGETPGVIDLSGVSGTASYTFAYCSSITKVVLSPNYQELTQNVFEGCTNLTQIGEIPGTIDLRNVSKMDSYSFLNCSSITKVLLSPNLDTIPSHAFENCSSLIQIGEKVNIVDLSGITTFKDGAFLKCSSIRRIELSSEVEALPNNIFDSCTSLTQIGDKEGIVDISWINTIGNYAFNNCNSIKTIYLSPELHVISSSAFKSCSDLKQIGETEDVIDLRNIIEINDYAFSFCDGMSKTILSSNLTKMGPGAFVYCTNLKVFSEAASEPSNWSSSWITNRNHVYYYRSEFTGDYNSYWHYNNGKAMLWGENLTITYELNYGTNYVGNSQTHSYGRVRTITDPTKVENEFLGWTVNDGETLIKDLVLGATEYTESIKLTAHWKPKEYLISFVSNGGNNIEDISIGYDQLIHLGEDPVKVGYTFKNWYLDEQLIYKFDLITMRAQNLTLYAKWTVNEYTITFNTNEGSNIEDINIEYESSIVLPIKPTKKGYKFDDWYKDETLINKLDFDKMPANNFKLYAKWIANEYTITLYLSEESTPEDIKVNYNETIVLPYYEPQTGYTFSGWYIDNQFYNQFDLKTMPDRNIELYAKWSINEYTINFNSNDGSAIKDIKIKFKENIILPQNPLKVGHTFENWYFDNQFTKKFNYEVMPSNDITLYAKWTINEYKISFTNGDGSVYEVYFKYNEDIIYDQETPVKEMTEDYIYEFIKWDNNPGKATNDMTFIAVFETKNRYYKDKIGDNDILIESNQGFDKDVEIVTETYENSLNFDKIPSGKKIDLVYRINAYKNNVLHNNLIDKVTITLPSKFKSNKVSVLVLENGLISEKEIEVLNGKITLATKSLSEIAILTDVSTSNSRTLIIIGVSIGVVAVVVSASIFIFLKKRKKAIK